MVVLILERVPTGLRGELTRWMIEPHAGVFVGRVAAIVRDKLWDKCRHEGNEGAGTMLFSSQSEQGFAVRSFGDTSRAIVDMEGVTLVRVPQRRRPRSRDAPASPPIPGLFDR